MNLLFLCTHNACRSVLAESIAQQVGQGLWTVTSAGSHPAGQIHPDTLSMLKNRGFPTQHLYSKSWDEVSNFNPDVVITVCDQASGESCPVWFGKAIKSQWGLPDPTQQSDPTLRRQHFEQLISTLELRLQQLAQIVRRESDISMEHLQLQLARLGDLA